MKTGTYLSAHGMMFVTRFT